MNEKNPSENPSQFPLIQRLSSVIRLIEDKGPIALKVIEYQKIISDPAKADDVTLNTYKRDIAQALIERGEVRRDEMVAMLRHQFGGHEVKKK